MNKLVYSFLVILTTSLMGSAFAIGKIGLDYASPIMLVALRFTIAGVVMGLIVYLLKRPHPKDLKCLCHIIVIGASQTDGVMGYFLVMLITFTSDDESI